MRTVLVTGGTGFIGSHTVEQLLAEGYHVRCLVRPDQTNLKWLEGLPVECARGDLLNTASIRECLDGVEYIIHIAGKTKAKYKSEYQTGNVVTTRNLLSAASQLKLLKKFCFISSLTAVGPSSTGVPLNESAPCHPITAYGTSKLEAEQLCRSYTDKIPLVILRPPAVFGPRDTDILEVFRWVNKGIKPVLGSSAKTVSLVYAPDLAKAIIRATFLEKTTGETYNIADPTIYRFTSVLACLAKAVGRRSIQITLPNALVYSMAGIAQCFAYMSKQPAVLNIEKARDLLQMHWVCDTQKMQTHLGFHPSTPLEVGINNTFQWYKEQGWL